MLSSYVVMVMVMVMVIVMVKVDGGGDGDGDGVVTNLLLFEPTVRLVLVLLQPLLNLVCH